MNKNWYANHIRYKKLQRIVLVPFFCAIMNCIFTAATHSGHLPIIGTKGINKSLSIVKLHPWAIPHEVSVSDEVFNFFAEADVDSWTCCSLSSVEWPKLPVNPFLFLLYLLYFIICIFLLYFYYTYCIYFLNLFYTL